MTLQRVESDDWPSLAGSADRIGAVGAEATRALNRSYQLALIDHSLSDAGASARTLENEVVVGALCTEPVYRYSALTLQFESNLLSIPAPAVQPLDMKISTG